MLSGPSGWLSEFLIKRTLRCPDGRPLYASEWWQRRYDGRQWAWEPLLASITWDQIHYPDLYTPVKQAWEWWKVDLVRLPTSVRYLGTFACQGGLPLALIGGADHKITHYLRTVLKYTVAYRQFVDDPIELARDKQHLLRPPTLRRDYVFRLTADLIEAVLDLEIDSELDDPLKALDETRAGWRDNMPLDLDDSHARELLSGLLREANRSRVDHVQNFRVERFLRNTAGGWRLGARVRLPSTISQDQLSRLLGVSKNSLPQRLQVILHGDRVRTLGVYAEREEDFLLMRNQQTPASEIWDAGAVIEVKLRFRSGVDIGDLIVPDRGIGLGDLPWIFRDDGNEPLFIGEGSVSNRSSKLLVLVSDDCKFEKITGRELVSESILDRTLWRIDEPTPVVTEDGRCLIRPSSGHETMEQDYRLSGQRIYSMECAWPIFRNAPTLRAARSEQIARPVPTNEVQWRLKGGEWQTRPDASAFGLWELRHVRAEELRFLGRVGIVPPQFDLSLEPGGDMSEGNLVLRGAEAVKIAIDDEGIEWSARNQEDTVRIHVTARDSNAPPARLKMWFYWRGGSELVVQAPFPGHGARFLRDGGTLGTRALAINDLYGVRATALSTQNDRFWLEGELEASDLGELHRVAYFRRPLQKYEDGTFHELALIELRPIIEQLLAASSSADAAVKLRVLDRAQREHASARVERFAATLEFDSSMNYLSTADKVENFEGSTVSCEALPLGQPNLDPVTCSIIPSHDGFLGAFLPQNLNMKEPWLVLVRHDDQVHVRPVTVGGESINASGIRDSETPRLCDAISVADSELRKKFISAAMDAMLDSRNKSRNEDEWQFMNDVLLHSTDIPATALDILKVLATKPRLLVQCLFRVEKSHRQLLWRLEDELPFSWLLVQRDIWWNEAKFAFDRLREELSVLFEVSCDQIAREQITSILNEGVERLPGLETVAKDFALRLKGGTLSESFVSSVCKLRDDRTPAQITLRSDMDDWPNGDGRNEWAQELERGNLLLKFGGWQHEGEHWKRQPIFDTPIAAAWCSVFAKPTSRTTFLVKRIRAHDPKWFDLAFGAAWFRFARLADKVNDRK